MPGRLCVPTSGNLGHTDQGGDKTGRGMGDEGMHALVSLVALATQTP